MSKYNRVIKGVEVDVYDILKAYEVTDPALQHLIKKALCAGLRGHKDRDQDLADIVESAKRAQDMHYSVGLESGYTFSVVRVKVEDPTINDVIDNAVKPCGAIDDVPLLFKEGKLNNVNLDDYFESLKIKSDDVSGFREAVRQCLLFEQLPGGILHK